MHYIIAKPFFFFFYLVADEVKWSPAGSNYVIVKGSCIEVYDVASCKLVHSVDFKERVTALLFLTVSV